MIRTLARMTAGLAIACAAMTTNVACGQPAPAAKPVAAPGAVVRHVTQGRAQTVIDNLFRCTVKVSNHRISAVGRITATDGTVLTVPAETAYQKGTRGADLFNECNKVVPQKTAEVSDANVPIVEIDRDGEVVTGYIVADNYFELYVNGKLIAVDAVPYTPFNSTIVKFKAKRPYTYAFKLVDWEEDLGLGTEIGVRDGPWSFNLVFDNLVLARKTVR